MASAHLRICKTAAWLSLIFILLIATGSHMWAQSTSTTTLGISATSVSWPKPVTLTATVTSSGSAVMPGLVKFCNASAASCQGPALLGQAQLTSGGKANITLVPVIGAHSVKAVFAGTNAVAASSSGAQTVTVTGLAASMTTIGGSGASPYAFTATVAGYGKSALAGSVTFNDASNGNLILGTATLGKATTALAFNPSALAAGNGPAALAVGDFNGDGFSDIVMGNSNADSNGNYSLSVLLSTGPGTYATPITIGLPSSFQNAAAIAVGDFNNDGFLDLAVAGGNSNEAAILLGNGAGSFTTAGIAATGFTPLSIVVGDFNGDGNADVAVSNRGSSTVTVLLGDGAGNLNPTSQSPATGSYPYAVAVGDFNGDGKQDLAVANYFDSDVTVLLGNGDGTFTPTSSSPAVGTYPYAIVVGDFNGDGKQDLAVVNQFTKTVSVLLGDGKGDFTATSTSPATGNFPDSVAVGDFNGDGIQDLAVANSSDNTISIFLGKGDGTFPTTQLVSVASGTAPQAVAAADFNGDGFEDVAVAGVANNTAVIAFNSTNTSATASASGITVQGGGTHSITASFAGSSNYATSTSSPVSVNGTIIPTTLNLSVAPKGPIGVGETILLTFTITPGQVGTLTPTGQMQLYNGSTLVTQLSIAGSPLQLNYELTVTGTDVLSAVYSGDANFTGSKSGTVNITVISPTASATTLTTSANSVTAQTPVTLTATVTSGGKPVTQGTVQFIGCFPVLGGCAPPISVWGTAQLTANGTASLKVALPVGANWLYANFVGTNDVLLSNSLKSIQTVTVTGTLPSTTALTTTGTAGNYALTATVQGSWPEPFGTVSFVDTSNNNLALAMGHTDSTNSVFTQSSSIATGKYPYWIAVGDFNGDGKKDMAVANAYSNTVSILLNDGNGKFTIDTTAIPSTVSFNEPAGIAVGDFNGDGKLDLAVANYGSNTVTILLGTGTGSFTQKATYPGLSGAIGVVAADFNGDGKLDLAIASDGSNSIDAMNSVVILLGNGDGTFSVGPTIQDVGSIIEGIVSADFNGDGKADLAVASFSGISLLLGNGDGTFYVSTISTVSAEFLTVADFNVDGQPDLAFSSEFGGVDLLLNQGGGAFNLMPTSIPTSGGVSQIVAADFNGDGLPDVAVAYDSSSIDGVEIVYDPALGSSLPQAISLGSSTTPQGLAVGDFNGDGGPDLAVGEMGTGTVTTLLNSAVSTVSLTGFVVPGAGTHNIVASYTGAPYANSTSSPVPLTATQIPTTVTITPSPGWIVAANSPFTVNVAVSPTSADNYALTGTVALYEEEGLIGQATLTNGVASFTTTLPVADTYMLSAFYNGNMQFASSDSQLVIHVVPPSIVALSSSATSVASGTPVRLTAKVTSGGKPVTAGVVTFCNANAKVCDNSAVFGMASLTSTGSASLKLTLGLGTHSIKAIFAPTLSEAGATSSTVNVSVTGVHATTTALTDTVASGEYTLAAKVLANGAQPATGSVSFVDSTSGVTLGTSSLVAGTSGLSFTPETSSAVATNPQGIVAGDFNLDGKLDLAVANGGGTVTILLGNGNGTFTAKSNPAVGSDPTAIAVGDFNGDGILDLAVANYNSNNVTILLGNGDGTFTTKSSPAVGAAPDGVAVGDFNGDGKLDLAVSNDGSGTVSILLGNGDGTFTAGSILGAVGYPQQVAVADFNGDGKLDLAVVIFGADLVAIYQGSGDGTFVRTQSLPTGLNPGSVVVGDFNGDGKADLAVANFGDGTLSVFLNAGNGTFNAPATINVSSGNQLKSLIAADFNQDGKVDLAVTVYNQADAFILLGNGNGTFTLQLTALKTGMAPTTIAAGDFNGDGLLDVAVSNNQSNNVSVFVNSLKTAATATLSGVTITGTGNQSVEATYPGATNFGASTSNTLSLPSN